MRPTLILLAFCFTIPIVGQECLNPDFLENDFTVSYYNKKGKKERSVTYNILNSNNGYIFNITDLKNEFSNFEIQMYCTQTDMVFGGDFNLILFNPNIANSIDIILDGNVEYPNDFSIEIGSILKGLEFTAEFKTDVDFMQGKIYSYSTTRKVISFKKFLTSFGKLGTYVIESDYKTRFESNIINLNFSSSSKEYFSPELGIPIRTESYNKRGKLIAYSQLDGSYMMKGNDDKDCGMISKKVSEHKQQYDSHTCWLASIEMVLNLECMTAPDGIKLTKDGAMEADSENTEKLAEAVGLEHIAVKDAVSAEDLYSIFKNSNSALWLQSRINKQLYNIGSKDEYASHAIVMHGASKDCKTGKITVDIYDPWFESNDGRSNFRIDLDQFIENVKVYDILYRE